MTFVTAWLAVAGVAAAALPIAIHLFLRRRREPVRWGAMRLLEEVLRRQRRRRRLEQLVVLALRCLVLAFVGAAVAEPMLRGSIVGDRAGGRLILFVVDDSMTSGLRPSADAPSALERHVDAAAAVVERARPGDQIGIVGAAVPVRDLLLPPTSDHAAASAVLRSLRPLETPASIPEALAAAWAAVGRDEVDGRAVVVNLLSDFRRGTTTLEDPLAAAPAGASSSRPRELFLRFSTPATDEVANVQVVGIDPLRSLLIPGQGDGSGQVTVRLARFGPLDGGRTRVALEGEGLAPTAPREVRWEPGRSTLSVEFRIEPRSDGAGSAGRLPGGEFGGALGVVASVAPDALLPDDRFAAVLQARRAVRVAMIDRRTFGAELSVERLSAGQWLARALRPTDAAPMELFVEDPTRLSAAALRAADAAIVVRPDLLQADGLAALRELLRRGGLVFVVPPGEATVHLWAERFVEAMRLPWRIGIEVVESPEGLVLDERQRSSPLLRLIEAELPALIAPVRIHRRIPIELADGGGERVLEASGAPILVAGLARDERDAPLPGTVVLLATAPELGWTDLPVKPLMVPLVQEIVRQGVGLGQEGLRGRVGERPITGPSTTALVAVVPDDVGGRAERPVPRIDLRPAEDATGTRRAGIVERSGLYRQLDAAEVEVGLLAVNVDPAAGDTTPQSVESVEGWLRSSGAWSVLDLDDPGEALRSAESALPLPWFLLALALACAVAETILSRRFSHVEGRATGPAEAAA
ncbi:MAG TPA: BatA domain-containing protein [Phycisphaerales bacterium]|nr:BatA domain-containing protein [Phycisphaerales bacterium]HMP36045.1 BatA domain-containing protein [Phycisphaerales bacterium]